MEFIKILSGSSGAVSLLLLALLLPVFGAVAVWAISLYGQTIPGNTWRDRRDAIIWSSCGLTLASVAALQPYLGTEVAMLGLAGIGLSFGVDGLRYVLAVLVAVLWLLASLFSRGYLAHSGHKMRYYFFFLLGESGILCMLLSADLYTLLTGFFLLNVACWVLAGHLETDAAHAAANRTLISAVAGGLLALLGLYLLQHMFGTLRFTALQVLGATCRNRPLLYTAGGLLLGGFSLGCASWPTPRRMPATAFAPGPAAALLSGAVSVGWLFSAMVLGGLLFWWDHTWGLLLTAAGVALMLVGAAASLLSRDLKQILTLLSVSQMGMILLGLGLNCLLASKNDVAAAAVVLHTVHHGIAQLVLFLSAGAVGMHLPRLDLDEIQGFGKGKPALFVGFLMGGMSICGVPLLSGSVSLTLLFEAAGNYAALAVKLGGSGMVFRLVQGLLILSCGFTCAAVGRLAHRLFFRENANPTLQARYAALSTRGLSPLMQALLVLSGALLPLLGVTASVSLRTLARSCVGFFSTGLTEGVTALRADAFLLFAAYAAVGAVVYLLLGRLPHPAKDPE